MLLVLHKFFIEKICAKPKMTIQNLVSGMKIKVQKYKCLKAFKKRSVGTVGG